MSSDMESTMGAVLDHVRHYRPPVFVAEFDSSNFAFRAIGATREEALKALIDGLERHAMEYDIPMDWYYWATYGSADEWAAEEANVHSVAIGRCTRDGEEF